jgi:hypothetical protein
VKPGEKRGLVLAAAGAAALGALALTGRRAPVKYSYGGPDFRNGKGQLLSRDPAKLLPSFAARLEVLFQRLRARRHPRTGFPFDPLLHEGRRERARAEGLAVEGVGSKNSLHIYGAAADIISKSKGWNDPEFFKALGEEARAVGLFWGGDWDDDGVREPGEDDQPHVQAVPATPKAQNELRASRTPDAVARRYLA